MRALPEREKAVAMKTNESECEIGPLLSPYHDGELPAARAAEVAEHVKTCPACATELDELRRLSETFASARMPVLTPNRVQRMQLQEPGFEVLPSTHHEGFASAIRSGQGN